MINDELNKKADSKTLDHPALFILWQIDITKLVKAPGCGSAYCGPIKMSTTNSRIENHLLSTIGDSKSKVNRLFLQYSFWDDI